MTLSTYGYESGLFDPTACSVIVKTVWVSTMGSGRRLGTGHQLRGGGATKWENCGSETFCAPPPQDMVKLVVPPTF